MAIPVAAFHELIRRVLDETGLAPQYLDWSSQNASCYRTQT
jgi:hypothetical protein